MTSPPPRRAPLSPPERFFLAAGLLAGLAYLLAFPPLSIADEPRHLYRATGIALGRLVPEVRGDHAGDTIPASLLRLVGELGVGEPLAIDRERRLDPAAVRAAFAWPLEPDRRVFVDLEGTALYPFVAHLAPAVGVAAGCALEASPPLVVYLGRLTNLLLATFLTWLAVRWSPVGRWPLALLALTPMAVSSRASLSADAITTALAFLFLALVARLAWGEPARRDRWLLPLVAGALCLTKLPYVLLLLALAVVPPERLALRRRAGQWLLLAALVVAAVAFTAWSASRPRADLRPGLATDRQRQVAEMAAHPVRFAGILARDLAVHTDRYAAQLVGLELGWVDVRLPVPLVVGYGVLVLLVALGCGADVRVTAPQRLVAAGVAGLLTAVIAASQYAVWTPVGADYVEGVQGRYFLPLVPLAVWVLHRRRGREPAGGWLLWAVVAFYGVLTAVAIARVVARYYG